MRLFLHLIEIKNSRQSLPRPYTNATACVYAGCIVSPRWIITWDHVLEVGLNSSTNSWLSHLGAKCLGSLISVALHPDPKQRGFILCFCSDTTTHTYNRAAHTVQCKETDKLSDRRCVWISLQQKAIKEYESCGNVVSFFEHIVSSTDRNRSLHNSVTEWHSCSQAILSVEPISYKCRRKWAISRWHKQRNTHRLHPYDYVFVWKKRFRMSVFALYQF